MIKKIYNWVIEKSATKHAQYWLFLIAFVESSFFPIPPDVLLITILLADRFKWISAFSICLIGSVLGGI
ncbi:MAG: DedA family protein, partial [bacterium]|nr:DedA family protein [bacterium]